MISNKSKKVNLEFSERLTLSGAEGSGVERVKIIRSAFVLRATVLIGMMAADWYQTFGLSI